VLTCGPLELDAARHEARYDGRPVPLTAKEFALLRYFMMHAGEVLTAERLLEHVWDEQADPFTNTVRVTISNLRRKLGVCGDAVGVETVIGRGYRLQERTS
jgi:DNA-binding response OmpR family regulator